MSAGLRRRRLLLAAGILAIAPAARAQAVVPDWLRELRACTAALPGGATWDAAGTTRGVIPMPRQPRATRLQILPYHLDPEQVLIGSIEVRAADARLELAPAVELPNGFEQRIVGRVRLVGDALPFGAAALKVAYEKETGRLAAACLELSSAESFGRAAMRIGELGLPEVPGAVPDEGITRYLEAPGRVFVLARRGAASSLAYAHVERLRAALRGT